MRQVGTKNKPWFQTSLSWRDHETTAALWPEDKSAVNILECVIVIIIIITTNNNDNNNIITVL